MLDMFVAALITAASPAAVVAQASTEPPVVLSAQSTATTASQTQDSVGVFTHCQDVESLRPDSANNDFSPLRGISIPQGISKKDWAAKVNLQVTELEAPKHGKVKVLDPSWYSYTFIPNEDYLGKDRVVYRVEAQGKRYKVTINFWVVPIIADPKGGDPFKQDCESQKFNGSGIDPGNLFGQLGDTVTGCLMGGLPFGSGSSA